MALIDSYSFLDVYFTLVGPGGLSVAIGGSNSATDGEGITIAPTGQKNVMHQGADGSILHNLIASRAAKLTVTLMRTSPHNDTLQEAFNFQTMSALTHGAMTATVTNDAQTETHTMKGVAFAKSPEDSYKTESSTVVWEFDVGVLTSKRGGRVQPF